MSTSSLPTFESLKLSLPLRQVLQELGYTAPTAIQAQSIPMLLKGKDLIGQSQTGSGKTAAFALPILEALLQQFPPGSLKSLGQDRQIYALVLCPTRELCAQVTREIRKLGRKNAGLQVLELVGGAPIGPQLNALEKGIHWVVGTPGRVIDHLKRRSVDFSNIKTLVLDEADRMLEMGFQDDMEHILKATPQNRQTVLFSATFPQTIETISRNYQKNPIRITVEKTNSTVATIRQTAYEIAPSYKLKALLWLIQQSEPESVIVFCNFKASVIELARNLEKTGLSVGALHGDLEQNDRDRVMAKFRNQSIKLLVATDVAARGIDVAGLDMVVNFELPQKAEVYVHRVGRTGRAGKKGLAVSFYISRETSRLEGIEKYAGLEIQRKNTPDFDHLEDATLIREVTSKQPPMQTLYIAGGRKDKVRPGDILGALTSKEIGLKAEQIGKIEIHDRFSYVAIAQSVIKVTLDRLRNGKIKGRKLSVHLVK